MTCPYCNHEMEKGVIESSREIAWKRKKTFITAAKFHKDAVVLAPQLYITNTFVVAYLCRNCKKVIIDYDDQTDIMNY